MLAEHRTFREIASALEKDPSTISKEVRRRIVHKKTGGMGANYNACLLRFKCTRSHICTVCHADRRYKLCRRCTMCNTFCNDFVKDVCIKISRPPYVCNGCGTRISCTLEKRLYDAKAADREYRTVLSENRTGISLSEEEVRHIDGIIAPLIRNGQSIHHACSQNKDTVVMSERTLYRYVDSGILSVRNIDLPRKVRFSARKQKVHAKVDKKCRQGRIYTDFLSFLEQHPGIPITELDSVEGKKGSKVLLTIHFKKAEMMLAFIRDHNDSSSVIEIFNALYSTLGKDNFMKIFKVCLADNGSEFSNPAAIEKDPDGCSRTRVFYCDPSSPFQKGSRAQLFQYTHPPASAAPPMKSICASQAELYPYVVYTR